MLVIVFYTLVTLLSSHRGLNDIVKFCKKFFTFLLFHLFHLPIFPLFVFNSLSSPLEVYNARFWKFLLERSPLAKIRNFIRHCATNVKMRFRFNKVGDLALPCKMIDMKIRRVTSNNLAYQFCQFSPIWNVDHLVGRILQNNLNYLLIWTSTVQCVATTTGFFFRVSLFLL